MFSYRHAFHAGNHADVLKHVVLMLVLKHLCMKDKALAYIDTHAGAGMYALDTGFATKSGEAAQGIERLWGREDWPTVLLPYRELLQALNPDGRLRYYPGSPYVAHAMMRPQDQLRYFELHPTDANLLRENVRRWQKIPQRGPTLNAEISDGFLGLRARLPPPSRRGLILIDPPYEDKQDYQRVVEAVDDGLTRFATGTFIVWFPQVARFSARQLPLQLKETTASSGLVLSLTVGKVQIASKALMSSGLCILNPPWTLLAALKETLPYLCAVLAQDETADFTLDHWEKS